MTEAKFVKEVTVIDPDSKGEVEISIFKHENGGMFGVDSSYLDQCFDEGPVVVPDPLSSDLVAFVDLIFPPVEKYYQVSQKDWHKCEDAGMFSFSVYRSLDTIKNDWPDCEISTYYGDDIEDHIYID